jgi:uncharacterized protein YdhG (YjbR/CyaY superfamily)
MKSPKPNVDAYIAAAPKEVQTKLKQMRAAITQTAPSATEYISYGMPAYKYEKPFIGFAAMKNHIGLYPMSGSPPTRKSLRATAHQKAQSSFRSISHFLSASSKES